MLIERCDKMGNVKKDTKKKEVSCSNDARFMMIFVLVSAFIMVLGQVIIDSEWFFSLTVNATQVGDDNMKQALQFITDSFTLLKVALSLAILVLAVIYRVDDKKKSLNTTLLDWYIIGAIFGVVGLIGLSIIIYIVTTMYFVIKENKKK